MNRPCVSSNERDVALTHEIGTRSNPTASVYTFTSTRIVARVFLYLASCSHGNRYTCFCHGSQPIRVASRFYDRPERSTPATGHLFRFPFTFASPFRDSGGFGVRRCLEIRSKGWSENERSIESRYLAYYNRYNEDWFFVAYGGRLTFFIAPFKPAAIRATINKHGSPFGRLPLRFDPR